MALSPATVDERLAPGAADEGWHIIPKVHGTRKTLSYIYVAPCGVRFGSMQAARDSLHDGGEEALKAEQRIAAGENSPMIRLSPPPRRLFFRPQPTKA